MRTQKSSMNRGSISVALVGVLSVAIPLTSALIAVAGGVLTQQRIEGAVDSAALAASDIRRGLSAGNPCATAAEIAAIASASLETCRIVSDCVLVELAATHVFWVIRAAALAGPP